MASIEYRGMIKRSSEHSYRVVVSAGYDESGKKSRIIRAFRYPDSMTEKARLRAVEKEASLLTAQYERREVVSAKQYTMRSFADMFMSEHVQENLKIKTRFEYGRQLDVICRYIGKIRLSSITAIDIQSMYKKMRAAGLKGPTLGHYHSVLSSMFSKAIHWQLITVNPCKLVENPGSKSTTLKKRVRKIRFLSYDQAITLLTYLEDEPLKYQLAIHCALYGGARRSEIGGLEWSDFNFEAGTIHIQRQSNYTPDDGVYEDDPKTESGDRFIQPPEHVMELAKKYHTAWEIERETMHADNLEHPNRVFTQWDGKPIHPDTFAGRFRKLLERIRADQRRTMSTTGLADAEIETTLIPIIRFHDLRHTCGTMRKSLGETLEDVGAYLGHASKASTMIYTHAMLDQQKSISERMAVATKIPE